MFLGIDKQAGDSIALKDDTGIAVTYEELCNLSKDIGSCVPTRAVVFLLCKNCVGAVAGYLGFVDHESIPVMLNYRIDQALLNNLLSIYTPAYIWCPSDLSLDFSFRVVYETLGYSLLETGYSVYPVCDSLQLCMTTSGSTGSPKLVRYKKGNLEANAKNVAISFGWSSRERSICDLSMSYTMGLNIINTHLYVGATCLLTNYNLLSADFWDFIKKERGTNFCGVPFSYDLLKRLRFEQMDLPYLTTITSGGGKLTDQRFMELADYAERTGKRFIASFGTTETSARMAVLPPELATIKTGSIGCAIPEGELFLVDEEGNIVGDLVAEGELCYKGPNVTMGYAENKSDLLEGDIFQGVYRTGDLARRDKDGFYYITGRLSRFLKLLSYRVSLDQCEILIKEKFGIECACSGSDDQMNIYVEDGLQSEEIKNFISKKTGIYSSMFKVIEVPRILRNDSGKIRYKELDKKYGQ